jgi:hypothetical protein
LIFKTCAEDETFYEVVIWKVEEESKFDTFIAGLQAILIPHSLDLCSNTEDEEATYDDIQNSAKNFIKVMVTKRNRRLLKGIKELKDIHEYIDLTWLDPEIPEELSARWILQLTQGYLFLLNLDNEDSLNTNEISNLLRNKWSDHLITCTEFWFGNDSSPVTNLKGKILLDFLSQVHLPFEKVCSWLTDKNSDFQKGIDSVCKFIASSSEILEYLISKTNEHQVLLAQWVPIINTLLRIASDPIKVLRNFIKFIPQEWKEPLEDDDRKADQLRIYSVIAHNWKMQGLFKDPDWQESNLLLTHFLSQINDYSLEAHPVFVKYECLNLIGILYNLTCPTKKANDVGITKQKIIGEVLQPTIFRIMNQYFPLWSHEIRPDTREKRYYEMIFDGLLNLITFCKNPLTLKLLYRVIKEDKTLLEYKLAQALHALITKGINKLPLAEFLIKTKEIFSEFIDFESENSYLGSQSIHNNLRFGIVERWLLKLFKECPFDYLTPIINDLAPKLVKILQQDLDTENIENLMFQLKEKGYILQIFNVWTSRTDWSDKTSIKDFYNSIKVQGVELTKCLIKICHYGSFVSIPAFAEGKLENDKMTEDWKKIVDLYTWSCWNCICSLISTTQSKELVFEKFLFTSSTTETPLWNLLVPDTIEYKFWVETNFKVQTFNNEDTLEVCQEDEIIKRFNDNFFANDNLLMAAPLESKLGDKPKADRREQDKVRQMVDNDDQNYGMEVDSQDDQNNLKDEDFELDEVNTHPCMLSILKVIDTLYEKFATTWTNDAMPGWMQRLFDALVTEGKHESLLLTKSARLFILKLIINRPHVFKRYSNIWFKHLTDYVVSKETGGKGLHYFLRDVWMVLVNFSEDIEIESDFKKQRWNDVINWLIKYAADKRKLIFTHNITLIGKLMDNWRDWNIQLNEILLSKMLNSKEGEVQNSELWRMAGIQIIALACKIGVRSHLLVNLIKQLDHKKRSIIFSASEVIGVLLSNQPELLEEASTKIQEMFSGEAKQDMLVSIVQKISKYQEKFAVEKPIFKKLISYLRPFSAMFRSCILQSLKSCITECLKQKTKNEYLREIWICLHAHHEDIIADKDEQCQQSFILLLKELVNVKIKERDNLFEVLWDYEAPLNIHNLIQASNNKNQLTRGLYCDLMVALYNDSSKFKSMAENSLIKWIGDQNEIIKSKLLMFWSDPSRMSLNPSQRLLTMMKYKNLFEDEQAWLKATVWLLLDISKHYKVIDRSSPSKPSRVDSKREDVSMDQEDDMDVENDNKEESKSQSKSLMKESQEEDPFPEQLSLNQASFGQTLEWNSTLQKDSNYYKSFQNESFLMTMQENDGQFGGFKHPSNITKGYAGTQSNNPKTLLKLQTAKIQDPKMTLNQNQKIVPAGKRRAVAGLSKFFENNQIKMPVHSVGLNKNVRFGPDGVYRVNKNQLKETKKKQEEQLIKHRKELKIKTLTSKRSYENKKESEKLYQLTLDVLHPLQAIILLDSEIASSLFYNLFYSIYSLETDKKVREELSEKAIRITCESVAWDTDTMSSFLLILLKLRSTHDNIDIKAIERVGIKSLNFSKAILLLEELIIHQKGDASKRPGIMNKSKDKNKEWTCLKRLHEASGNYCWAN